MSKPPCCGERHRNWRQGVGGACLGVFSVIAALMTKPPVFEVWVLIVWNNHVVTMVKATYPLPRLPVTDQRVRT